MQSLHIFRKCEAIAFFKHIFVYVFSTYVAEFQTHTWIESSMHYFSTVFLDSPRSVVCTPGPVVTMYYKQKKCHTLA